MSAPGSPNIRIDMNMVGLPPGRIITSSGDTVDLEALVQVGGDRLAQRRNADRRRVAVVAVAQRLDRGLDDEVGRAEIGLADAEIDDVAALRRAARWRAPARRRRSPRRCGRRQGRFSAWKSPSHSSHARTSDAVSRIANLSCAGLCPQHVLPDMQTWMAGPSPAMTTATEVKTVTALRHARRTIAGVRCLIEGAPTCCIMA